MSSSLDVFEDEAFSAETVRSYVHAAAFEDFSSRGKRVQRWTSAHPHFPQGE